MTAYEPLSKRMCKWPGCTEPVGMGTKRDRLHCPEHAATRKRLMAKLRQRLKRDKDKRAETVRLRKEVERANAVKIPDAIRMAIRLLRGDFLG